MLPSVITANEQLLVAGAVEQAASSSLTKRGEQGPSQKRRTAPVRPKAPAEKTAKTEMTFFQKIASVMETADKQTMSAKGIFEALKERGLLPPRRARERVGTLLATDKKHFERVGHALYRLRPPPLKEIPWDQLRKTILRTLVSHGKPISAFDLGKLVGSQGHIFVPLLVQLRDYGGLKKIDNKDGTLWQPVIEKIRSFDEEHGVAAFNNGVAGAAPN
jgi:hypothetical protein